MKVLVLGSGAKDNAMAWWFSKSRLVEDLYVAPGNPGTASFAVNLDNIDPSDKIQVLEACKKHSVDFVFIGTESPLESGVVDYLNSNGISTFGAPLASLKLEADRKFARKFASRHNIPMPAYHVFENQNDLDAYLKDNTCKVHTIKPNGLSPSRMIINSSDSRIISAKARELFKMGSVVIEDHIDGLPVTVSAFMDDRSMFVLPISSEYTGRGNEDVSTVTGGMGAVCPIPLSDEVRSNIRSRILEPTVNALKEENLHYKGVLTFSIVVSGKDPYLVDYHVRLNDPATQSFVPLMKNDIVEIMQAMNDNTLCDVKLSTSDRYSVAVVIASSGYPDKPRTGLKLKNVKGNMLEISSTDSFVFFGAVGYGKDGGIYTNGGRTATVVGLGNNIVEANEKAYDFVPEIDFKDAWHRKDIGNDFFNHEKEE